jgi:competence protein ComEC
LPSPILFVLLAFAAGVILLQTRTDLPAHPIAFGVAALLLIGGASRAGRISRSLQQPAGATPARWRSAPLMLVAIVAISASAALGYGYAGWRAAMRLSDALPGEWEGEELQVVGVVDELPRPGLHGARFAFAVEQVITPGAAVPGRLSLAWYARSPPASEADEAQAPPELLPAVHAGERWWLTVRVARPHGSVNPAGFDLEGWLFAHDLRATGSVRPERDNVRLDAFAGRPGDHVERARERIRDRIFATLPEARYAGVLAALTVGDQRAIPEPQWAVFNRTGVSHLVSISGLHVTAFAMLAAGLAAALLRCFPMITSRCPARKLAVLAGFCAAAGYVALAGAEVPALRTLAMLAVSAAGLWLGRPGTGRLVWLWSLVAVLLLDPWAPLAPGFWLSFGAVALLIYALGSRLYDRPAGLAARMLHTLQQASRTQWAVTIGLVPLTLALFGQVSLVSPVANALAIPLVTFVVVPIALLAVAIPVAALWDFAHRALELLMHVLEPLAALPEAAWQQHAPLPWTTLAGLAGVALLLAPRGVPGRAFGVVWLLPLFLVRPPAPPAGSAVVTVLDVGQGLALAVRTAHHALVYDTGPRYSESADAGGRIVAPFLRAAGMPALSGLVVSHSDTDHSGGALSLLATVPAAWMSSSLADDNAIVRRQREHGSATRCEAGQRWEWDGVRFAMLHPDASAYGDALRKANDLSCVLRIDTAHGSLLVTGDIEARSEYELLARDRQSLAADVLIVPHHGSRTSSTPAFIAAVAPRIAIVTAGHRNRFGHPRPDIVARYLVREVALPRTDQDGAVIVTLRDGGVAIERVRETARRYWHAARAGPEQLR